MDLCDPSQLGMRLERPQIQSFIPFPAIIRGMYL